MDQSDEETRQVLLIAESKGLEAAFYDICRDQVRRDGRISENQRSADWKYLLPLNQDSNALVFGSGMGTIPISLAESCSKVYAIDSGWHKIVFLNKRKNQQRVKNLYPIYVNGDLNLPFLDHQFDLITVGEFGWKGKKSFQFEDLIQTIDNLLNVDGMLFLSLENRLGFQKFLWRKEEGVFPSLHTIVGYKRILQAKGFINVQIYAPLPSPRGTPLFYLPLDDTQALKFFFQHIFPLFEAVSPEVKQSYDFEYFFAKLTVRVAQIFGLICLTKFFVPGFNIIAQKAS